MAHTSYLRHRTKALEVSHVRHLTFNSSRLTSHAPGHSISEHGKRTRRTLHLNSLGTTNGHHTGKGRARPLILPLAIPRLLHVARKKVLPRRHNACNAKNAQSLSVEVPYAACRCAHVPNLPMPSPHRHQKQAHRPNESIRLRCGIAPPGSWRCESCGVRGLAHEWNLSTFRLSTPANPNNSLVHT